MIGSKSNMIFQRAAKKKQQAFVTMMTSKLSQSTANNINN